MKSKEPGSLRYHPINIDFVLKHPDKSGETTAITTCKEYHQIAENSSVGWYAATTFAMGRDTIMGQVCQMIDHLEHARSYKTNYFDLESDTWWKSISTDIIQSAHRDDVLPGEIRTKMYRIDGSTLGEAVNPENVSSYELYPISFVLHKFKDASYGDTVTIIDEFDLEPLALGDFTGNSVADLLVRTRRIPRTEELNSGYFGSIHGVGSGNIIVLEKPSPKRSATQISVKELLDDK